MAMNDWLQEGIDAVQQTYTQHNHSRKREKVAWDFYFIVIAQKDSFLLLWMGHFL